MFYSINTTVSNLAILSLIFCGVIYLYIGAQPVCISIQNPSHSSYATVNVSKDELEVALSRISTGNKTLIITMVNKAYAEPHSESYPSMLDLFLESFWLGEDTRSLIDNLLVVAVDQTAYRRCKFRRLHCYRLGTDDADFAGEKVYMSEDFIKMMWRRTFFLLDVLNRGYDFIFTDTDIMWLRNPLPRLTSGNKSEDLLISTDLFDSQWFNTGFYYIRSNNKTVQLFETWYAAKDNSTGMKEQDVLVSLRAKGVFGKLGLSVRVLDTRYFSGFCCKNSDIGAVMTVHANCCRSIGAKVADLTTVLRVWKKFKEADASMDENNGKVPVLSFQLSQHVACWNSWKEHEKTL